MTSSTSLTTSDVADSETEALRATIDDLEVGQNELFVRIQNYRRQVQLADGPRLLYHYTDTAGLLGIIQNNKLWATDINYLNDASELLYACSLVENLVEQWHAKAETEIQREFFRRARLSFDFSRTLDVFVGCFCEQGDLLSQWRGYARGGEGYSIGLETRQLRNLGSFGLDYFLGRVEYNRATQETILKTILSMVVDGLSRRVGRKKSAKSAMAQINECCKIFQQSVWYSLVTFKNVTFEAENEWRIIRALPKEVALSRCRFRSSGSKLIPFVELNFSNLTGGFGPKSAKLPIRQVFHGPTLNPELSGRALQLLLKKNSYAEVEVLGSKIPLRL